MSTMSLLFLFICLLASTSLKTEAANPSYARHVCSNTTTFAPNTTYQFNLEHLLSVLSSNATREFYNATAGRLPSSSVYGLFFCRGDVTTAVCRECVTFAVEDAVRLCPIEKENIIWYDECQLRYSDSSFFGTMDTSLVFPIWNFGSVTEQDRFNDLLAISMREASAEAAKGGTGQKKYATKEAKFTNFQTLYNLVQCSPDLSPADCNRCLVTAIANLPSCCAGKQGGRVLFPSCNVRYELYPFYAVNTSSPPSRPPGSEGILQVQRSNHARI